MTRDLLCQKCGKRTLTPEDIVDGYRERKVELRVKKPEQHGLHINGEFMPMVGMTCDCCGNPIVEGSIAVARTCWQSCLEGEPAFWEDEFLGVEPVQASKPKD